MKKLYLASAGAGILAAVTYIAAYDSFNMASYMLYQNSYLIPVFATGTIVGVYICAVLSIGCLERFATGVIDMIEKDLKR